MAVFGKSYATPVAGLGGTCYKANDGTWALTVSHTR
jgi:hypothetical protein